MSTHTRQTTGRAGEQTKRAAGHSMDIPPPATPHNGDGTRRTTHGPELEERHLRDAADGWEATHNRTAAVRQVPTRGALAQARMLSVAAGLRVLEGPS